MGEDRPAEEKQTKRARRHPQFSECSSVLGMAELLKAPPFCYDEGMVATAPITTAAQLALAADLGRCELIRGDLVMMSPAGAQHGAVALKMGSILLGFVNLHGLGAVVGAESGFQIARNPDTVRAPDVAFIRAGRVVGGLPQGFFPGPPDLAVEVLSPSDRASEVIAKVEDWLGAGCRAVWVVNPQTRTVTAYEGGGNAAVLAATDALDGGELLPGFRVPVAEIFVT
jgi:Uma2 family endonuclease